MSSTTIVSRPLKRLERQTRENNDRAFAFICLLLATLWRKETMRYSHGGRQAASVHAQRHGNAQNRQVLSRSFLAQLIKAAFASKWSRDCLVQRIFAPRQAKRRKIVWPRKETTISCSFIRVKFRQHNLTETKWSWYEWVNIVFTCQHWHLHPSFALVLVQV